MVQSAHRATVHLDLRNILGFNRLRSHHRLQDRRQFFGLYAQDLGRRLEQFRLGQEEMAEIGRCRERVGQARFEPLFAVDGDAQLLRDLVGGLEADAPDVLGQPIGIGFNGRDGLVPIGLVDLHRVGRGDAFGLQEQHDVADLALFVPRLLDHRNPLFADALHSQQRARLVLDDLQRLQAEQLHHPLCITGPTPLISPLPRYFSMAKAVAGLLVCSAPPQTVARTPGAPSTDLARQLLSHDRVREVSDQRDQIPRPLHRQPPDRIAVLLIVVGDTFQHPDQRFQRARSGRDRVSIVLR